MIGGLVFSILVSGGQTAPYDVRLKAEELLWKALVYSSDSPAEKLRQVRDMEASLGAFEFPGLTQRQYLIALWQATGQLDKVFAELEVMFSRGWIGSNQFADFPRENQKLLTDPRWAPLEKKLLAAQAKAWTELQPASFGLDRQKAEQSLQSLLSANDPDKLVRNCAQGLPHAQPTKTGEWMFDSVAFTAADKAQKEFKYFVYIPKGYRASRKIPAVLYSHQGWFYRRRPMPWQLLTNQADNPFWFSPKAREWVQIYPLSWQDVDGSTRFGQSIHLQVLRQVKLMLNLDEDRIVIAGHSNGGSTAYRALAENPTSFAAAVAINGWPDPRMAMRNWANRSILGFTGERDDIFPPAEVQKLNQWATQNGTKTWNLIFVPKGRHDYIAWIDDYRDGLTRYIDRARRTPLSSQKILQCPEKRSARVDWLRIDEVDSGLPRAVWDSELVTPEVAINGDGAGGSPKGRHVQNQSSGTVKAFYRANTFTLETSRVTRLTLLLSPKVVDLSKPITVVLNGKSTVHHAKTDADFLREEYVVNLDRSALFTAKIELNIPKLP